MYIYENDIVNTSDTATSDITPSNPGRRETCVASYVDEGWCFIVSPLQSVFYINFISLKVFLLARQVARRSRAPFVKANMVSNVDSGL